MWRKSSFSMGNGNCVEIDEWRTSSYTYGGGNCVECTEWRTSSYSPCVNCVEVGNGIQVRDSKNPDGTVLTFDQNTWGKFLKSLK